MGSAVPRPSYKHGFGVDYLLPIFSGNPWFKGDKHCILKKNPKFLFRYQTPFDADCLIVGISQSTSDKHKLVWSLPGFDFTSEYGKVLNTLSSQIIPLGHNYMVCSNYTPLMCDLIFSLSVLLEMIFVVIFFSYR